MDGNFKFVNEHYQNQFSFYSENWIGLHSYNLVHPDDQEKCLIATNKIIANPHEVVEVQIRKGTPIANEYFWTTWEFSLLMDEYGFPLGIMCVGHNITESKLANEKALEFERKADSIIENISEGFFVVNKNWEFLKFNHAAEKLLGLSKEKVLGKSFWKFFPQNSQYQFPKLLLWAFEKNESISFEEKELNRDVIYKATVYPSPEGITVFFKDVTEERTIANSLLHSESKLRALLDSTSDCNVLISPDFKVLSYNKQASITMFQLSHKELNEGDDFRDFIFEDAEIPFLKAFNMALNGQVVKIERELKVESNKYVWFSISYYPVYDHQNNLMGVSFDSVDIDQRKRVEINLQKKNEMLNSISWKQSHEVRKPVANILGLVNLLKETEEEEERNLYIKHLEEESNDLDDIIHEIVHKISDYYYLGEK